MSENRRDSLAGAFAELSGGKPMPSDVEIKQALRDWAAAKFKRQGGSVIYECPLKRSRGTRAISIACSVYGTEPALFNTLLQCRVWVDPDEGLYSEIALEDPVFADGTLVLGELPLEALEVAEQELQRLESKAACLPVEMPRWCQLRLTLGA